MVLVGRVLSRYELKCLCVLIGSPEVWYAHVRQVLELDHEAN